jgi:hypothetical protein
MPTVLLMRINERECLERAAYCADLAEGEQDPRMRMFLERLARQWVQAAEEASASSESSPSTPHGASIPST